MSKESDAKDKEFRRDSYWNKERLEAHAAPRLEFNPEKKQWVGLTDEEFHDLQIEHGDDIWANFKAIEANLKDKNT